MNNSENQTNLDCPIYTDTSDEWIDFFNFWVGGVFQSFVAIPGFIGKFFNTTNMDLKNFVRYLKEFFGSKSLNFRVIRKKITFRDFICKDDRKSLYFCYKHLQCISCPLIFQKLYILG